MENASQIVASLRFISRILKKLVLIILARVLSAFEEEEWRVSLRYSRGASSHSFDLRSVLRRRVILALVIMEEPYSERLGDLPKVTHVVRIGARI